ncbi:MAG TPA: hypothetical protein VMW17_11300 [Candidatus Binatia bacterium]|nr:hypothetical protein [Candidatus Binatia bacterium]
MANERRGKRLRVDSDGVKIETSGVRPGVWLLLAAVAVIVVALMVRRGHRSEEATVAAGSRETMRREPVMSAPAKSAQAPAVMRVAPKAVPMRIAAATPASDEAIAASDTAPAGDSEPTPSAEEAQSDAPMFGPVTPGEPSGIALFPPPGTKPIKRGIVVPDGFELPPGYVRHYQTTDEGQQLAPILMFHPDYQPLDEHGVPIPVPADRVVPPELAPAGMPIHMLEPPGTPSGMDHTP